MKFIALLVATVAADAPLSGKALVTLDATLKKIYDAEDARIKKAGKYDTTATVSEKEAIDKKLKELAAARAAEDKAERTTVGFDKMSSDAQTYYTDNIKKWREAEYKACAADAKAIMCTKAKSIRANDVKFLETKKYWTQNTLGRQNLDKELLTARK